MIAEQKIASMGIELPAMSEPKAMYVPVVQTGNLCICFRQIPMVMGTRWFYTRENLRYTDTGRGTVRC